jgi:pyruvate,water dikinase
LTIPKDEPLIRDIEGRLYFNATAIERSLALATKTKEFPIAKFFGGKSNAGQIKLTFAGKVGFLSYGAKVIFYSIVSSWTFRAKIGEAEKMSGELERRIGAASDLEELLALELQAFAYLRSVTISAIKTLLYPLTFYFIFSHLCKKWLIDKTGEKANSFLASGSRQIALIRAFEELWDLSRIIKNDRVLSHKFLKAQTITKAEAVLRDSPDAITAWREFLKKYGHRSVKEVDFSLPRWKEDPSFLINTLKLYLGASEDINPASKIEKLAIKREILLCETKRLLSRWKFTIFKSVLGFAESAQILREQVKAILVLLLFPLRSVYLKIGLKLRERGFLKDADDIFYLSSDEIGALRSGSLPGDFGLAGLVARRKNEYKRFAGLKMKETIINGKEVSLVSDPDLRIRDYSVKFLQGLGVSSGIGQGVARIATNVDELWRIKPGEILVCDRLDPGWTPVFVVVKGLVSNTGGLLSHASIVAREYGLPAVVNVEFATSKILDGQKIIVDGNRGTVKIISGAGND